MIAAPRRYPTGLPVPVTCAEAGQPTVPHAEVVRWLETWGTPAFKPWHER
jgi:hypothetical protein